MPDLIQFFQIKSFISLESSPIQFSPLKYQFSGKILWRKGEGILLHYTKIPSDKLLAWNNRPNQVRDRLAGWLLADPSIARFGLVFYQKSNKVVGGQRGERVRRYVILCYVMLCLSCAIFLVVKWLEVTRRNTIGIQFPTRPIFNDLFLLRCFRQDHFHEHRDPDAIFPVISLKDSSGVC